MTLIGGPCPTCGQHPAERGVVYGIDAFVCESFPAGTLMLINDDWLRSPGFMHPQFPLDLNLTSITEQCAPELSPVAREVTVAYVPAAVRALVRLDYARALEEERARYDWAAILWAAIGVSYHPRPGPVARILARRNRIPDPRLGESAVSPTRHLENWQNRACTPSSLRSPTT